MKSKITNFLMFVIMMVLFCAIFIFGKAIYWEISNNSTSNILYTVNTIDTTILEENKKSIKDNKNETNFENEIIIEDVSDSKQVSINDKYFYTQLTDTQKKIYDGLYQNKENMMSGKFTIQYGDAFSNILDKENGSTILGDDYQAAVESFLYDNPDVFYIDANKLYLNIETTTRLLKKTYSVFIGPAENSTYFAKGFKSEKEVRVAKRKIETIKNNILSNLKGNTYKNILFIHDYLVENIEYDKNSKSNGRYSIYGALIDKKCVCEGYSKAFKYLLNEANIYCEIMQGTATNSSGKNENHAWNCVYLNKKWYHIDVTWDDPIIIGNGRISNSTKYKYFLKGKKTINKDHKLSYQFSDKGRNYSYPKTSENDYR